MEYRLWTICLAQEIPDEHSFVSAQIKRAAVLYTKLPKNNGDNFKNDKLSEVKKLLNIEAEQVTYVQTFKNNENELGRLIERLNLLDSFGSLLRKNFKSIDEILEKIKGKSAAQNSTVDSKVLQIQLKIEREKEALKIWTENLLPEIESILKPEFQSSENVVFETENLKNQLIKIRQLLAGSNEKYIEEIFGFVDDAKTYFKKSSEVFQLEKQQKGVEKIRSEGTKERQADLTALRTSLGNEKLDLEKSIEQIKRACTVLYRTNVEEELYEAVANWLIERPITILRGRAWDYEKTKAFHARETNPEKILQDYQIAKKTFDEIKKTLVDLKDLISDLNNKEPAKDEVKNLLKKAFDSYTEIESRLTSPVEPKVRQSWWTRMVNRVKNRLRR